LSTETLNHLRRQAKMNYERGNFLVSTDPGLLDMEFLCRGLNSTYWAATRPREVIEESIRNSLCFGVYEKESKQQVGFARVVTDKITFSWVCDVFITDSYRKRGLGKWLMACVVEHPDVKRTLSVLGTKDAHGLYEKYGFVRTELMKRPSQANQAPTAVTPAPAGKPPVGGLRNASPGETQKARQP
jgi:GNAT superfamily N-acetyltransferase